MEDLNAPLIVAVLLGAETTSSRVPGGERVGEGGAEVARWFTNTSRKHPICPPKNTGSKKPSTNKSCRYF